MNQTQGNDFQPDSQNVSQIRSLDYLIRQYPNQDLIPQFKKLQQTYPCYRAIRGDGNCFYRAIAFLYLREADLSRFNNVFQEIQDYSTGHSLFFEGITFKEKLKQLFYKELFDLNDTFGEIRQQQLTKCFNNSIVFDMIMIMYFRSLNYKYIIQHERDFISFVTSRDSIQRVRKYGVDSEGIEYESMAKALNVQIEMKITDQFHLKSQFYNMDSSKTSFQIFFRPGHFDLLYHKNSLYLQRFLNKRQNVNDSNKVPEMIVTIKYRQNPLIQRNNVPQKPINTQPKKILPQKKFIIPESKIIQTPRKSPTKTNISNYLFSPFSSLTNLRSSEKKQVPKQEKQQPILLTKDLQIDKIYRERILESKRKKSQQNFLPKQIYKTPQSESIEQRQPFQKVKQVLILITFFAGLLYICFGF